MRINEVTTRIESGLESTTQTPRKGIVILLHGLGSNSWLMSLLAHRLHLEGYQVVNWGYWSLWQSLENLIPHFKQRLTKLAGTIDPEVPVQIVAHSMGAIITRASLEDVDLPNLQRIVMLAPPNRGAWVATWVGPYLRWLSPLVDELADRTDSYVNRLQTRLRSDVEVGVIAAAWDYVLIEQSTHLDCESDHITLPSRHCGLVLRRKVAEQIAHFLNHGAFKRELVPEVSLDDVPELVIAENGETATLAPASFEAELVRGLNGQSSCSVSSEG